MGPQRKIRPRLGLFLLLGLLLTLSRPRWHARVLTLCLTMGLSLLGGGLLTLAHAQGTSTATVVSTILTGRVVAADNG